MNHSPYKKMFITKFVDPFLPKKKIILFVNRRLTGLTVCEIKLFKENQLHAF